MCSSDLNSKTLRLHTDAGNIGANIHIHKAVCILRNKTINTLYGNVPSFSHTFQTSKAIKGFINYASKPHASLNYSSVNAY